MPRMILPGSDVMAGARPPAKSPLRWEKYCVLSPCHACVCVISAPPPWTGSFATFPNQALIGLNVPQQRRRRRHHKCQALPQKSKLRAKLLGSKRKTYNRSIVKPTFWAKPKCHQNGDGKAGEYPAADALQDRGDALDRLFSRHAKALGGSHPKPFHAYPSFLSV